MKDFQDNIYIKEVLAGNTNSYTYLVNKYKDYVYTICYRILKNKEQTEEIAQDTFVKAYQKLSSFEQKSKFSTWLYTIAFNLCISSKRKNKIQFFDIEKVNKDTLNQIIDIQGLKHLEKSDQKKFIHIALDKLNEQDGLLLTLFYLNENSIAEIKSITGLSESNVKVKLHRARKRIYIILEKLLKNELKSIL